MHAWRGAEAVKPSAELARHQHLGDPWADVDEVAERAEGGVGQDSAVYVQHHAC